MECVAAVNMASRHLFPAHSTLRKGTFFSKVRVILRTPRTSQLQATQLVHGPLGLQSGKTAQGKCVVTFGFTEGRSPHGPPLPEGAMPLSGLLCICLAPSFLKGRLSKPGYSTLFPWHLPRVPATPAGRRDKSAAAEVGCRMPRGR